MIKKIIKNLKLLVVACPENNFQPRFLEVNFLFRLVLIFLILRIIVLPFYFYFPKSLFFAQIITQDILQLLNNERQSLGLNSLKQDPKLEKAALLKAQDMFNKDYFGHQSPDGISGWYWIKMSSYDYAAAGENLAIGFIDSGEVHQAWNESELHRQNLLSPYFEDVGIVVLKGNFQNQETTVVVQLFGKPKATTIPGFIAIEKQKIEAKTESEMDTEAEAEVETKIKEEIKIPQSEVPEEIAPEVAPSITTNLSERESSLKSGIWQFLVQKYSNFLRGFIFFIVFIILIILISNLIVIVALSLPKKQKLVIARAVIPASLLTIIVLLVLAILDKSFLIQFIPHHLQI